MKSIFYMVFFTALAGLTKAQEEVVFKVSSGTSGRVLTI